MRDHVLRRRDFFMSGVWIGRFPGKPLLEQRGDPRRTITERFNLLILDKDRVAANPVVAAYCAVYQFRITNPAVIRLSVGQQRSFLEVLELDFEHIHPGTLCRQVIREGIVGEWPGVPFTP